MEGSKEERRTRAQRVPALQLWFSNKPVFALKPLKNGGKSAFNSRLVELTELLSPWKPKDFLTLQKNTEEAIYVAVTHTHRCSSTQSNAAIHLSMINTHMRWGAYIKGLGPLQTRLLVLKRNIVFHFLCLAIPLFFLAPNGFFKSAMASLTALQSKQIYSPSLWLSSRWISFVNRLKERKCTGDALFVRSLLGSNS